MRKWIFIALSVVVSAVFLWLTLRDVPLQEVGATIASANVFWVIVSFLSVGMALFTRGVRWRIMVGYRIPVLHSFYIFSITMLINQLPLRAGEVARTLLATRYQVPFVTAATSVLVERLIDVLIVVVMVAYGISKVPNAPETTTRGAVIFGVLAVIAFGVLFVFARFPQIPRQIVAWLESRLTFLHRLNLSKRVDEVLDGLRPLANLRTGAYTILWTVIAWVTSISTMYTLALAFNLPAENPQIDFVALSSLSVGLAALGVAIPVTVASIGPFQGAVRVASELLGLNAVIAATLGIMFHGVTLLAYGVFGAIGLLALGVSFSDFSGANAKTESGEIASAEKAS
jgi:glycosyltransferase 2 family protein